MKILISNIFEISIIIITCWLYTVCKSRNLFKIQGDYGHYLKNQWTGLFAHLNAFHADSKNGNENLNFEHLKGKKSENLACRLWLKSTWKELK